MRHDRHGSTQKYLRLLRLECRTATRNIASAETLGRVMAAAGIRLVYGGGSVGLMGILARTVMAHGGKVTGIIPQFLKDREVMLKEVTDLSHRRHA